jgi:hypothetical protein
VSVAIVSSVGARRVDAGDVRVCVQEGPESGGKADVAAPVEERAIEAEVVACPYSKV